MSGLLDVSFRYPHSYRRAVLGFASMVAMRFVD
jgi:hypothetical protein